MKKVLATLLVLVLTFSAFAGGSTESTTTTNTAVGTTNNIVTATDGKTQFSGTVNVGVITSLSSTMAATNGWYLAALEASASVVNAHGGIDGKQLVYSLYDPESDAGTVKQRLTDIKNSGCIAAIYSAGDALSPAAAQWAAENDFPVFITSNISTEVTLGNYSKNAFNMSKNAWGLAKILALYCVGEEGCKNFCFVGTDGAATIDAENFLIYEGQKIDPEFKMLASYRVNWNDIEYSNIISAVSSLKPEMVLQQGGGPNFVSFCQQASIFDLFSSCDVYNDLVTSASTNQPLIEGDEFPYGHTHGVFSYPFWDYSLITGEIKEYDDAFYATETAKKNGYYPDDNFIINYFVTKCIEYAVEACVEKGIDYTKDSNAFSEAISEVHFSDSFGEHYFRTDIDNQFTANMFYGTSYEDSNYAGVAICKEYVTYTAEEYLPTADEMKAWGSTHGFDVSRFN